MNFSNKAAIAMMACALSSGCSLGGYVRVDASEYENAINDYDNRVLLRNIFRARDGIPVSFTELSTITGSLSASAGLSVTAPFGDLHGSNTKARSIQQLM